MKALGRVAKFVEEDWNSNPVRFILETIAWFLSIGASVIMALTVPNPPLLIVYIFWVVGCGLYAWCALTRGSFGMLANYILLTAIDTYGLIAIL